MKISLKWLSDWVDTTATKPSVLAEKLTMAGLEVESITSLLPFWKNIRIARIISCEKHPQADRLQVCQVDAGESEPLQIVCGAPNARPDIFVPLAMIGTQMDAEFTIKKAKLRGVESFGMLCSARELGLSEENSGLLEFPSDVTPGTDLIEYLQLQDNLIEVDLTPNRGDCLSMIGVAREVSVLLNSPLKTPDILPVEAVTQKHLPIEIQAPQDCPRYLGRVIENIDASAPTPIYIRERLRRSGIRSLNILVDVTNYSLIELGQPMHAFDLDKLQGGIRVRRAAKEESLTLLDGKTVLLDEECLVIADHNQAVALAGVSGGQETAVSNATKNVFLESAFFSPISIAGRARRFGMHTDASHRYERGVDPNMARTAIERATQLLVSIAGGSPGPVVEALSQDHLPIKQPIMLRPAYVHKLLGIAIEPTEIVRILKQLGMTVEPVGEEYRITPPLFRFDINLEVDLIEELGRIYGYNRLPMTRYHGPDIIKPLAESEVSLSRIKQCLTNAGMHEVITYSFIDSDWQNKLTDVTDSLLLTNPISEEMNVMRASLWPGLIEVAQNNLNRQEERIRLFESGLVFHKQENTIEQTSTLAGLIVGAQEKEAWNIKEDSVDFYDIKGIVEQVISMTDDLASFRFVTSSHVALHPGKCADLLRNGKKIGVLGAIHPQLANHFDLPKNTYLFEIKLKNIIIGQLSAFQTLSRFPSVRRDLAFVVNDSVCASELTEAIKSIEPTLIKSVSVFDQFKGKGIEEGDKSLAIAIILHDLTRTLIDSDVDAVISQITQQLGDQFNAQLRN